MASTQMMSAPAGDANAALRAPPASATSASVQMVTPADILLPAFVQKRPGGLYVNPTGIGDAARFISFVDQVFTYGAYFSELDVGNLNRLMYDLEEVARDGVPVRLAAEMRPFPQRRRVLYKTLKTSSDGSSAEYVFTQVYLEFDDSAPDGGDAAGGENAVGTWKGNRAQSEPARLDFDEFIAHLWTNGVRAGIDASRVRRAITMGETGRIRVAYWIEPTPGKDAGVEEKTKKLHRDNSPKLQRGGNADLGQFKNHFPQVEKDEALIRKTPCVPGIPGRKVGGELIEPEPPKDFDFSALAGPGTRLDQRGDGEYIVAGMTGFVSIDTATNQISIAEKIVNREGVNLRTTGNLTLSGDDYEEFGEVQEQRNVQGKNMTFHANVHGNLVSRGGLIVVEKNLISGKATSVGGEIDVLGRASASVIDAPKGKIHIKHAEGCSITGSHVVVDTATHCQIVGERVEVGVAAGCAVSAQSATIVVATNHKGRDTVITMLVPNLSENGQKMAAVSKRRAEVAAELDEQVQSMVKLRDQKEFGSFLQLQDRISKGEVKIAPAQEAGLMKLATRFGPMIQQLRGFSEKAARLRQTLAEVEGELQALRKAHDSAGTDVQCAIESITGDTVVRAMQHDADIDYLSGEGLKEVLNRVRGLDKSHDKLFVGDSGRFEWRFKPAPEPTPQAD